MTKHKDHRKFLDAYLEGHDYKGQKVTEEDMIRLEESTKASWSDLR